MNRFKIPAVAGVTILGLLGWLALGNIWIPSAILLAVLVGAAHSMQKAAWAWCRLATIILAVPCIFTGQLITAIVAIILATIVTTILRKTSQEN